MKLLDYLIFPSYIPINNKKKGTQNEQEYFRSVNLDNVYRSP